MTTPTPAAAPTQHSRFRPLWLGGLLILALVAILVVALWWFHRETHSITEDAFVEAHIVNIAPQTVSGHIVRFNVEENEHVEQGQLLAEIDPVPYKDQVNVAESKVKGAEAELARQQAGLKRLQEEVPQQIKIASRTYDAAVADEARAQAVLTLTETEVKKAIEEAQAALAAATANQVLAQQEYTRYTNLYDEKAAPLRRSQEVTRSRDAAVAQQTLAAVRLARAIADEKPRLDVATRTFKAAEETTRKAAAGVKLAETGNELIKETVLLVAVKNEAVDEAKRALQAAQNNLSFTKIRAPFPGIVVKRYRHLGDFASPGVAILSMLNPDLLYVTANLEEDRLRGVAPGNAVELQLDAFAEPFHGRVVWIDRSTGAQFALMPRNVVSGEFTKVVQRVPVRIWMDAKDPRWSQLRSGLSVRAVIAHGEGDQQWADKTAREMKAVEARYNQAKE